VPVHSPLSRGYRNAAKVATAYKLDTRWRNRIAFISNRQEAESFLKKKWETELEYRLIKELWAVDTDGWRLAVRCGATSSQARLCATCHNCRRQCAAFECAACAGAIPSASASTTTRATKFSYRAEHCSSQCNPA
jgi:Protein of unknown function (DUF1348)